MLKEKESYCSEKAEKSLWFRLSGGGVEVRNLC